MEIWIHYIPKNKHIPPGSAALVPPPSHAFLYLPLNPNPPTPPPSKQNSESGCLRWGFRGYEWEASGMKEISIYFKWNWYIVYFEFLDHLFARKMFFLVFKFSFLFIFCLFNIIFIVFIIIIIINLLLLTVFEVKCHSKALIFPMQIKWILIINQFFSAPIILFIINGCGLFA